MDTPREERLSAAAGLVAVAAVGLGTLFVDDGGVAGWRSVAWWSAYLIYVFALAVNAELVAAGRLAWATSGRLLTVQVVAGATAWLVLPDLGWTSVLFVVTAASAAFTLDVWRALVIVAGQSVLIGVGTAIDGDSASEILIATTVFGSFQLFAVLVVGSEYRQAAARAALARANADLHAANALLGAATRTSERLRISRDLHDVVGHQLTALTLELEVASHHADGDSAAHVARARSIAKDLLGDVRDVVSSMRSGTGDLEPTLRTLVDDVPGLAINLTVDERAPLAAPSAIAIVRCTQEAITNTLRHSGATELDIDVVVDDNGARLIAHDNGHGARHLVQGNGLNGLRERVEQLGGELAVHTAAGRGFTIDARVPAA